MISLVEISSLLKNWTTCGDTVVKARENIYNNKQ